MIILMNNKIINTYYFFRSNERVPKRKLEDEIKSEVVSFICFLLKKIYIYRSE